MKYFTSFIVLLITGSLSAQRAEIIPPAVEAASVGIYGDVPMDLCNGLPSISIPIHQITVGQENFNIALNYNSSGIKVDQRASSVGLGWSLSTGCFITRVVRGMPDDVKTSGPVNLILNTSVPVEVDDQEYIVYDNAGYLWSDNDVSLLNNITQNTVLTASQIQLLRKFALQAVDAEPDEFYFNIFGESGKFTFDQQGNIHLFSKTAVKIEPVITTSGIESFKITASSGVVYHLTVKEISQNHRLSFYYGYATDEDGSLPYRFTNPWLLSYVTVPYNSNAFGGVPNCNLRDLTTTFQNYNSFQKTPAFVSTWRVSKIEVPGNSDVTFEYQTRKTLNYYYGKTSGFRCFVYNNFYGVNAATPQEDKPDTTLDNYSISATITQEKFVEKISWHTGEINFFLENRDDIPAINISWSPNPVPAFAFVSEKSLRVRAIKIDDKLKGKQHFGFNYSYLNTDCDYPGVWAANCKRLFLDEITTIDNTKYSFQYDNQYQLPSIGSLKKDFYGYYNAANNSDEIPSMYFYPNLVANLESSEHFSPFSLYPLTNQGPYMYIDRGNNMSPVFAATKAGILKRITYPTKGYTEFEYESNKFMLNGAERLGPGLRIKQTTTSDLISPAIIKTFKYVKNDGTCSGVLHQVPIFARGTVPFSASNVNDFDLRRSTTFYNYNNIMGNSVVVNYSNVTVETQDSGREEYSYYVPLTAGKKYDLDTSGNYIFQINKAIVKRFTECWAQEGHPCMPGYVSPEYPVDYYPYVTIPDYEWNTGQLLEKNTYDNQGNKVETIINTYSTREINKRQFYKVAIGYTHLNGAGIMLTTSTPALSDEGQLVMEDSTGQLINHYFEDGKYDYFIAKSSVLSTYKYLSKTQEISWVGTNPISTTTEYKYGNDYLLKEKNYTNSNGEKSIIKYKHISDFGNNATVFGTTAIGKPVQIIKAKTDAVETVVVSGEIFTYNNNRVEKDYVLNPNKLLYTETQPPVSNSYYTDVYVNSSGEIVMDDNYELKNTILYDTKGNQVEAKSNYLNTGSVYIWGYNNTLLVAKIDNTTYEEVEEAIDLVALQNLSGSALDAQLNILRQQFTTSMITVYSYFDDSYTTIPTIHRWKLRAITDARSNTVFYKYDDNGKLKFVEDYLGNVIKEYKYNYKN